VRTISLTDQQIIKIAIATAGIILAIAAIWCAWEISTFSSLSASDAKWWVHTSELLLIASSILLALGLFGEWSDSESWKQRLLYKAAKASVIIGVLGELLGDGGIFAAGDRLQELEEIAIGDAITKAAEANGRAGKLEVDAAKLRSENLALEAKISPRKLSSEGTKSLRKVAATLNDRKISLWSYGLDIEGRLLATQIKSAFDAENVPILDSRGAMISSTVPRIGVIVTGEDDELVSALLSALESVAPIKGPTPGAFSAYSPTIPPVAPSVDAEIFVGIKPINP
jgi:hypothetical protein